MYGSNTKMRGIDGLEHLGTGAMGCWSTGILVHWDTGAHCRCNHKFECGNLVEFDLSADSVHECNCTRIPIFLSLTAAGQITV